MARSIRPAPHPRPLLKDRLRAWYLRLRHGNSIAWAQAVGFADLPLARALEAQGASAKEVESFTFMRAVDLKEPGFLEALLACGADPNTQNKNNYYDFALHRAAVGAMGRKLELLIKAGADLNCLDGNGYTPLAVAINGFGERVAEWEERRAHVSTLLHAGADATRWIWNDRESFLANAPLEIPLLEELIAHGADPLHLFNPSPSSGFAPLEYEPKLLFRAPEIPSLAQLEQFLWFMEKLGQGPDTRDQASGAPLLFHMVRDWQPASPKNNVPLGQAWSSLLDMLQARGHDLRARDQNGNTVWHIWAQHASTSFGWVGDALLNHPVLPSDAMTANKEGRTPLDIIRDREDWVKNSPRVDRYVAKLNEMGLEAALPSVQDEPSRPTPSRLRF